MKNILFVLMLTTLGACGESPLLNHSWENNKLVQDTFRSGSDVLKFSRSGFSFTVSWVEGPQLGASRFVLRTWNNSLGTSNGPYQDVPKTLNVFLWMPSMGHGSSPVKIKKTSDGEYEISEVQFIMAGKWEVKFQLKDGSQVLDETVVPLTL